MGIIKSHVHERPLVSLLKRQEKQTRNLTSCWRKGMDTEMIWREEAVFQQLTFDIEAILVFF